MIESNQEDHDREALRVVGEELISAIRTQIETVISLPQDVPHLTPARIALDAVNIAAQAYAEAHAKLTGIARPLLGYESDESEADHAGQASEDLSQTISIATRADYHIADSHDFVMEGRKAYRRLWSKASETEAAEHVNEIGDAIYELFHEKGTTALEHTPGVQLVGRTIWALEADSLLKGDPALWPSNPFDLASGDLTIHYVQNEPSTSADEDGPRG